MTKEEELKQEVKEKAGIYFDNLEVDHGNVSDTPFSAYDIFTAYEKGAMDFAEPREKCIAELEEAKANLEYLLEGKDNEIDELKKENKVLAQNLEDTEICENGWKNRVRELEAQIEKMKCCTNCINNYFLATEEPCCSCTRCYASTTKKTADKWEIKENEKH